MIATEFEAKRDPDRVCEGSPWHISKHVVILEDFNAHMQLSDLRFDKLQVWDRVVNLPYNLRNDVWGLVTVQRLGRMVEIDPVGGF